MGIFPKDDTFAEFSTHYGAGLASYVRHRPWVTAGDTVTGYTITNCVGDLHNGYSGAYNVASFRSQSGTGVATDMGAVLWRQAYLTNARVSMTFKGIAVLGSASANDFRFAGICARVSGGSYTDTTGQQSIRDTTGYWLMLAVDPTLSFSLRYRWLVLRVNAGVITVLSSTDASPQMNTLMTAARQIRLDVIDVAGNPVLTPYYDGVEMTALTVTDSSGSKITTAGRCGFGLGRDRQLTLPTRQIASMASRFTVFDVNTGTTLLADDFTRVNTLANPSVTDGNLATGNLLMSMWTLDIHGLTAFTTGATHLRDAGLNRIDAQGGIYSFSQIGAADPVTQSRSIVFRKSATAAYATGTGIFLRGVMSNTGAPTSGYLLTINYASTTYTAIIRRFSGGVPTPIATADVSTGYGLVNNVDYTMLASVITNGSIQQLLLTLNAIGVQNWTPLISGVTTAGSLVFDASAGAIPSGPAQALQIISFASTADGHIYYKLWTDEEAPDTGGGDTSEDPSVVLGSEIRGKTGVHTMPIDSEFEVSDAVRVHDQRYATGHVSRVLFDTRSRRRWRVTVTSASTTERQTLWDFWDAHGKAIPFDFTDPEGAGVIPAHFLDDALATARNGPLTSSFSYTVEELLSNVTISAIVPGTASLQIGTRAPSLNVATLGTRAVVITTYPPLVAIKFTPGVRSLTLTTFAPTRPP